MFQFSNIATVSLVENVRLIFHLFSRAPKSLYFSCVGRITHTHETLFFSFCSKQINEHSVTKTTKIHCQFQTPLFILSFVCHFYCIKWYIMLSVSSHICTQRIVCCFFFFSEINHLIEYICIQYTQLKLQPATITKQMSSPTFVVPISTNIQPLSPPKPFPIAPLTTNPIKTLTMTAPAKVNSTTTTQHLPLYLVSKSSEYHHHAQKNKK